MVSAIPNTWKILLRENSTLNTEYIVFADCIITIDNMTRRVHEIKTKDIYLHLLDDVTNRPTSERKWKEKTELDLTTEEWATIYTLNQHLTRDTKITNLQFKITHRIMACGSNLKNWKIRDSNSCETCNKHIDTIEHYLIECEPVKEFWNQVLNWWTNSIKVIFRLGIYEMLFGIPNDENDQIINQFNYILLMARYYIYVSKKKGEDLDMYKFLVQCKNQLDLEQKILSANKDSANFYRNYTKVYENL
jgi:hypothetical protein